MVVIGRWVVLIMGVFLMKKAVIFDFNGTLLWDTHLHNRAWDDFLKQYNINLSDEEKNHVIHGKTNQDIFTSLFNKKFDSLAMTQLSEEKESIYRKLCLEADVKLADGAIELFEYCKHNRIPFAIATSAGKENVDFYINRFNLLKWFDIDLIIYNDGTIKSKPDPEIFNIAIHKLNMSPEDVVIFEDSVAGINSAIAAKAGEIIIVNSNNEDYSLFNYPIIKDFSEYETCVKI